MSFDLIIKNGTVILENEARIVDIAVQAGKIAAIGENLGEAKQVMDATGLVVSPGMVDAHTHIGLFDFNQEIYGQIACVTLHQKIRDEAKFDDFDELLKAIQNDIAQCRAFFAQK